MAWRLAASLVTLRSEVNAWAPARSKASDGTIGDPAHASRASRHNPNRYGVVTALDITHDPANGCDVHALARRLVRRPHPELAYVISNRQISSRSAGWAWRPYTGSNAHTVHAHFAVGVGPDSAPEPPYDSTAPWGVAPSQSAPAPQEDEDVDVIIWFSPGPHAYKVNGPHATHIKTLAEVDTLKNFWKVPEFNNASTPAPSSEATRFLDGPLKNTASLADLRWLANDVKTTVAAQGGSAAGVAAEFAKRLAA